MFVKSTPFQQVCQLLLSLIVALVYKAGGRGLDSQDPANIHNHKITEENLKTLKPSLQVVSKEGFQNARTFHGLKRLNFEKKG